MQQCHLLKGKSVEWDPPLHAQLPRVVCMWPHGHIHAYTLPVPPQSPALGHQGLKIDHSVKVLPGLPFSRRRANVVAPLVVYDVVF